jgi:hypothetical protein
MKIADTPWPESIGILYIILVWSILSLVNLFY